MCQISDKTDFKISSFKPEKSMDLKKKIPVPYPIIYNPGLYRVNNERQKKIKPAGINEFKII